MSDLATDDRKKIALSFMKSASRQAYAMCADQAEAVAVEIENGALPMDAVTALRFLATLFRGSAGRE